MAKILDMPKLSPTMEEGVLSTWHKKEGDTVDVDDLLAEVETDKATMEFRSFDKGTILKVLVPAGSNVKLGQPVAILGKQGEDIAGLLSQTGGGARTPETHAAETSQATGSANGRAEGAQTISLPGANASPASPRSESPARSEERNGAEARGATQGRVSTGSPLDRTEREGAPSEAGTNGTGRVLASPYVRKTARDRGIDLGAVQGSGPGGRIVPQDLDSAGPSRGAIARPAPAADDAKGATSRLKAPETKPLSMMRKAIARRLTESKQTVPHFYLTIDVDAAPLLALRETINQELKTSDGKKDAAEAKPLKVSLNDLLIKACATALRRVPECNAQFTADAILVHQRVDVSVAVAVPDGLVTPVVRDADTKSVVRIAEEVRELAARARAKKLRPEEMQDGTFSISNLGMFGIDEFAAVINPPEGAILAVGQARDEAVVKDGAVVPGKKMAMTLSCDHRVVDGAVGAAFLAELRELLDRPMRILTG